MLQEIGALGEERHEMRAHLSARQSRRVGRAADGTHGGADDHAWLHAELIEGLEHEHVRKSPRRATAQCEGDALAPFASAFARIAHGFMSSAPARAV